MLVVTRKAGESINIGNVVVTVQRVVNGAQVRLVFDAPREVKIVRGELLGAHKVELLCEEIRAGKAKAGA